MNEAAPRKSSLPRGCVFSMTCVGPRLDWYVWDWYVWDWYVWDWDVWDWDVWDWDV